MCAYVSSADIKPLSLRSSWRSSQTSIFWSSNRKMPPVVLQEKLFPPSIMWSFSRSNDTTVFLWIIVTAGLKWGKITVLLFFFFFFFKSVMNCFVIDQARMWNVCLLGGDRSLCVSLFLSQCQIEDLLAAQHKRKWTIEKRKTVIK